MPDPITYATEAAIQDEILDKRLAEIRTMYERGEFTIREAAELRIAALEHHIETIRNLRHEYFG